jgi:type VI protein secretion system component Hcp
MSVLMHLPGITGESEIAGHAGWMELMSFRWGGTRPVMRTVRPNGSVVYQPNAPQLRNVTVSRLADSLSGLVWLEMVGLRTISPLKFEWLRTGSGAPETYFAVTLTGARITQIHEVSGGDRPVEEITFLYQQIEFSVRDVGDALTGVQDVVSYKIGAHAGA